jgi:hypothetical protein
MDLQNPQSRAGATNSASANSLVKSDGTNLVASSITDDGTNVSIFADTFKWNDVTVLTVEGLVTADQVGGTTTNDDAPLGSIGQYVSASVVQASGVSLVTATPKTVTSISLTAGDWDVTAVGAINGASTGTEFDVAIGATTNSMTGTVLGDSRAQTPTVSLAGSDATLIIPSFRVSIASTTTYYLIVQETFTVGSPKAYGRISARRVR